VPQFLLALGILAVSTSAPLIRWAEPAPPLLVAAGRVCLAAVILALIAGRSLAAVLRLPRRELLLCALSGLLLAAHFGAWITSLYYTSTAASVALVATQPIFGGALAWIFLGEGIGRREAFGITIAACGCVVLAGGDLDAGRGALIGDGLALAGALTAGGYYVVGRRMRTALPLSTYLATVNVVAGTLLAATALLAATPLRGFAPTDYIAIVGCALVPSIVGHTLLNWTVRRVRVHLVALAGLGEPIGASLLTWLFFAEAPPTHAALGGAVILVGIALGFIRR
jgi:drug/metabolite transporter (DMT)-like permease